MEFPTQIVKINTVFPRIVSSLEVSLLVSAVTIQNYEVNKCGNYMKISTFYTFKKTETIRGNMVYEDLELTLRPDYIFKMIQKEN